MSTSTVVECDTYTWNGTTYTSSGTYTWVGTNAAGCDSTATLNLTINNSSTSTSTVVACDSYTWNDSTYTQSGVYSYTGGGSSNDYHSMNFDGNSAVMISNNFNITKSKWYFSILGKIFWNQTPTEAGKRR